jgi:hypothetical protein
LQRLCRVLGTSRSGYYKHLATEDARAEHAAEKAATVAEIQFHVVVDLGDGSILAFGNPLVKGQVQPEGSPIPFVAEDGRWKMENR